LLAERKAAGTALLLISHDLAVVASIADRSLVMKGGRVVGEGRARQVLTAPAHDYTKALLAAVPSAASRGTGLTTGAPVARPEPNPYGRVLAGTGLTRSYGSRRVVADVSFGLHEGETLGIVGESGSGKTTLARLVLGLIEPDAGQVTLYGRPWSSLRERERRPLRPRIQLVSQNPLDSFDPRHTVGRLVAEPLRLPRAERRERVLDLLARVGLPPQTAARHPRELSGGQRQRVAIARALGPRPDVLGWRGPVSAVDVV